MSFPQNPVCHYTSVDALLQMTFADELVIEASHIASFEDISEGNVVRNEAADRLITIASQIDQSNETGGEFAQKMKTMALQMQTTQIQREAYVLSLSEAVDSLPMWRLYGAGGAGVCLVFDTEILQNQVKKWVGTLQPVDYTDFYKSDLGSLIGAMFEDVHMLPFFKNSKYYDPSRATSEHIIGWLRSEGEHIQMLVNNKSLFCKNKAFEFEREIRAVFVAPEHSDLRVVFRGGTRAPIARLRLPIHKDLIDGILTKVILAPGLDALSLVSRQRVEALVTTFKNRKPIFKNVNFEPSAIPFYSNYGR
jgi:Protein of unknown function (DUF2971)